MRFVCLLVLKISQYKIIPGTSESMLFFYGYTQPEQGFIKSLCGFQNPWTAKEHDEGLKKTLKVPQKLPQQEHLNWLKLKLELPGTNR